MLRFHEDLLRRQKAKQDFIDSKVLDAINEAAGEVITISELAKIKDRLYVNVFPGHKDYFLDDNFIIRVVEPDPTICRGINVFFAYPHQLDEIPKPVKFTGTY